MRYVREEATYIFYNILNVYVGIAKPPQGNG